MSDAEIVVLGASDTGKTCFMLAMYDDMRIGYGGFTFSATDVDVDRLLVQRFDQLVETRGADRWPSGTSAVEEYEFNLNYAMRRFMVFSWHDYRGGMVDDSGEPNAQLRKLVALSHVVLICCPGDLAYEAGRGDRKALRKLRVAETQQLIEAIGDTGHSLGILVTKADRYSKRHVENNPDASPEETEEALVSDIRALYQNFFVPGGGWRVMICPITLGTDLAEHEDSAEIAPVNMHLPVMFAYYEYARMLEEQWQARMFQKEGEVAGLQSNFLKRFFTKERVREALKDLEKLTGHFETVRARRSIASERLGNLCYYIDGQEVSIG